MGQVLSTLCCVRNTRILTYRCPKSDSLEDILLQFSPILSRIYDPNLIITISDGEYD